MRNFTHVVDAGLAEVQPSLEKCPHRPQLLTVQEGIIGGPWLCLEHPHCDETLATAFEPSSQEPPPESSADSTSTVHKQRNRLQG
jgi:hypothetical protein